jgi:hypothetical protein
VIDIPLLYTTLHKKGFPPTIADKFVNEWRHYKSFVSKVSEGMVVLICISKSIPVNKEHNLAKTVNFVNELFNIDIKWTPELTFQEFKKQLFLLTVPERAKEFINKNEKGAKLWNSLKMK